MQFHADKLEERALRLKNYEISKVKNAIYILQRRRATGSLAGSRVHKGPTYPVPYSQTAKLMQPPRRSSASRLADRGAVSLRVLARVDPLAGSRHAGVGPAHGSSGIMQDVMSRCDQRHPGLRRM